MDKRTTTIILIIVSLTALIFPNFVYTTKAQSAQATIMSCSGAIAHTSVHLRGVNYNTVRLDDLTIEILDRDFSRFEQDRINIIGLSLYWYRLEGNQRGDYNGTYKDGTSYGDVYLDCVKKVIEIAESYNIKVIISFHTLWREIGDEWCTPDYVVDLEGHNTHLAIVESEESKQAFLNMVNHTVTYLKNEKIFAWGLLNEPWGKDYADGFIDLIQRESVLVKQITNSLVTVKFVCAHTWTLGNGSQGMLNHFASVFKWNQQIFESLDFISLNSYIQYPELYNTWQNITIENVNGIIQKGKSVLITEFGFQSNNDTLQAEYYEKTLDVFNNLPLIGWIAWNWNQFKLSNLGISWNLLKDDQGNPRPAYDEIIKANN